MLQQAETVRLVNASGSIISVTNLEIGDEIIVRNDNQMRHIGNALDGEMREK
jgi:3-dehydroquinate synthase class II